MGNATFEANESVGNLKNKMSQRGKMKVTAGISMGKQVDGYLAPTG